MITQHQAVALYHAANTLTSRILNLNACAPSFGNEFQNLCFALAAIDDGHYEPAMQAEPQADPKQGSLLG